MEPRLELPRDFKELIALFLSHKVRFMVVGAYALGLRVPFLSLADLRENKLAAGRLKDLADLEQLPLQ